MENTEVSPSSFSLDLQGAINNEQDSDICFLVRGERIYAHKGILVHRSKYFETMFHPLSSFKEKDQKEFIIDETISVPIFLAILSYLYTGVENIVQPETAVDILQAADLFLLSDMKDFIESYMISSIDADSISLDPSYISFLLELSDRFQLYKLKRFCLELTVESSIDNWNSIRNSQGFNELKFSNPQLVREIDYLASRKNLVLPGELLMRKVPTVVY